MRIIMQRIVNRATTQLVWIGEKDNEPVRTKGAIHNVFY